MGCVLSMINNIHPEYHSEASRVKREKHFQWQRSTGALQDLFPEGIETVLSYIDLLGRVAAVPSSTILPCNFFKKLLFSHVESCGSLADFTVIMTAVGRDLKQLGNDQQCIILIKS